MGNLLAFAPCVEIGPTAEPLLGKPTRPPSDGMQMSPEQRARFDSLEARLRYVEGRTQERSDKAGQRKTNAEASASRKKERAKALRSRDEVWTWSLENSSLVGTSVYRLCGERSYSSLVLPRSNHRSRRRQKIKNEMTPHWRSWPPQILPWLQDWQSPTKNELFGHA